MKVPLDNVVGIAIVARVFSLTIVIGIGELRLVAAAVHEVKVITPKSGREYSLNWPPFIETSGASTIHSAEDRSGVDESVTVAV